MRILNTSGRVQAVAGVGTWEVDGTRDVYDQPVIEGLLRNPYFVEAEDQPEDVDPEVTEPELEPVIVGNVAVNPPIPGVITETETTEPPKEQGAELFGDQNAPDPDPNDE